VGRTAWLLSEEIVAIVPVLTGAGVQRILIDALGSAVVVLRNLRVGGERKRALWKLVGRCLI